jgi:hypothetical protein
MGQAEQIARIERLLDRENYVLQDERWWTKAILELFYEQIFNLSMEEGAPLRAEEIPRRWLRQLGQVGTEDQSLLRIFAGTQAQ